MNTALAQGSYSGELETRLERLLIEDKAREATALIQKAINQASDPNDPAMAARLIYWLGKAEMRLNGNQEFTATIRQKDSLLRQDDAPETRYHALLGLSRLYNETGDLTLATQLGLEALNAARETGTGEHLATASYYVGEYGLRAGDFEQFERHTRASLGFILQATDRKYAISPKTHNYMGALMYLTGKPDSSLIYYETALSLTGVMKQNSENRLYFPAAIKANLVLLYQSLNEYETALELARECVVLNSRFLREEPNHPLRFRSLRNQSLAYRNLASLYEQIGDYDNTLFIAEKAHAHAREHFEPGLLEYFSAVTLYSEAMVANRDFEQALVVQQEAKASLEAMPQENPLLWANYSSISASAYFGLERYEEARMYYEQAQGYFERAQSDPLSSDRVFATINLALSYMELGQKADTYRTLEESFADLLSIDSPNSRLLNAVLTARARTAYYFSDYPLVLEYTELFLRSNQQNLSTAVQAYLPEILLYQAQARYALAQVRTPELLGQIDDILSKALQTLEDRKILFSGEDNADALIREHSAVFDFAKRIKLERFRATEDRVYLRELVQVHESALYHRIRSRLNSRNYAIDFNLPEEVLQRETSLRSGWDPTEQTIEDFVSYKQDWEVFLDSLRTRYPKYFNLKYASITADLDQLQARIEPGTTVVRYLFIESQLYAYLVNSEREELLELPALDLATDIGLIADYRNSTPEISLALNRLYAGLWRELARHISGERVIIVPDGPLFNLSFELLTPESLTGFAELADHGLLAKYDLSYHYSLQLLQEGTRPSDFERNYVAFVPSFDAGMKTSYAHSVTDSSLLDADYLSLLPQPFGLELARSAGKRFGGKVFYGPEATKEVFSQGAGGARIIHIGSHAESNNVNPALSRLVFAKDLSDSTRKEDNYLQAYEIYNLNLDSELTALTACETGKPGFQPGEGMVSLAHAFNYAGSRSLVTSLWQIDEKASAQILKSFYGYLGKGYRRDRALRLAKLEYLKTAQSRAQHPQYWAGLAVMGEASALTLPDSSGTVWLLWLILPLLAGAFWVYRTKKTSG